MFLEKNSWLNDDDCHLTTLRLPFSTTLGAPNALVPVDQSRTLPMDQSLILPIDQPESSNKSLLTNHGPSLWTNHGPCLLTNKISQISKPRSILFFTNKQRNICYSNNVWKDLSVLRTERDNSFSCLKICFRLWKKSSLFMALIYKFKYFLQRGLR